MVQELARSFNQHQPPTNRTLRAGLQILSDTDLRSRLSDLKVETQVIAGRNDRVVPVKASEYLFSRLGNGHSMHQFNTGHMPFLQAPSNYIEVLTSLVNSAQ